MHVKAPVAALTDLQLATSNHLPTDCIALQGYEYTRLDKQPRLPRNLSLLSLYARQGRRQHASNFKFTLNGVLSELVKSV